MTSDADGPSSMGFTSGGPDAGLDRHRPMSGGERQGVAIARALHFEAELIILDEPTMGLSLTETEKRSTSCADQGRRQVGIFIDHNLFHVHEICERVVVIDRGRVAGEFGRPR